MTKNQYIEYLQELGIEFFQSDQGLCYAKISKGDATYALSLDSGDFKQFVMLRIYEKFGKAMDDRQLKTIAVACRAKALFGEDKRNVYIRTAPIDPTNPFEGIEIDLGNDQGECVRITKNSIEVDQPSVLFLRPQNLLPLPKPADSGDILKLFDYINVDGNEQRLTLLSFVINALLPEGPYPLLILTGQEGSGKTSATEFLSSVIDPRTGVNRAMNQNERELAISASRSHLMTFDNLSGIRFNISDFLCRLSTGGTFEIRRLYTDTDVLEINFSKPVIMNSIVDLVSKPDLAQRTYILELTSLSEKNRKTKSELKKSFVEDQPVIFRGICEAIQMGLQMRKVTKLLKPPRMADCAKFAASASPAFGSTPDAVVKAMEKVQDNQRLYIASVDPVFQAVQSLMEKVTEWDGTATELYNLLGETFSADGIPRPSNWPKTVENFSKDLNRLQGNLLGMGIKYEKERTAKSRTIRLSRASSITKLVEEYARVSIA